MRFIELLAPAKDLSCGIAAIDHGADAVYIGASRFGARAAAGNSTDDIAQLCRYAHRFAARVYVTINTLIYDDEIDDTRQLILQLADVGVDAFIIQDMAVKALVDELNANRENVKHIACHASTQTDNRTAEKIESIDKVSAVRYGEGMVDKMIKAFSSVEKVTYGIVIALVIVTVFLIINTIKLTISARRREIAIMRLVGASNITIKLPFIIEGMILGLFGSIIPVIVTTYGYLAFYKHFDGYLYSRLIELIVPEPFIYQTSLIVIGIGILVGMVGSASAVRKYLKV